MRIDATVCTYLIHVILLLDSSFNTSYSIVYEVLKPVYILLFNPSQTRINYIFYLINLYTNVYNVK